MSNAIDSPRITLFEDRPKQGMVLQLNLGVYLDARVTFAVSLKDFKKILTGPDKPHLVIVRDAFKGASVTARVAELARPLGIPVVSMGGQESEGVVAVPDADDVKPLLQASAKLLGITARHMAGKERDPHYEIAADFLSMLFTVPCDIYDRKADGGLEKVFSAGESIVRSKVDRFVQHRRPLVIESLQRLRLANSVTEQALRAAADLAGPNVPTEKKMAILNSSLDMVAAQFKSAGMDAETIELANSSIKAIEKIADGSTSVGNLVKQLLESGSGYRYLHSQLLTFLGFHVIKMMGWWGEDQRNIISQAAFYHDISLTDDESARVHSLQELKDSGIRDPQRIEAILSHPQAAARELQTVPDVHPDAVRVVLQHHGAPQGKGFSTDIAKLDNLSKAFLLSEEWACYIIGLSDTQNAPDANARIAELKAKYFDDLSVQILETFRYLDPDQFANDFLFPPDAGEVEQVIRVAKGETTPEAEVQALMEAGELLTSEEASVVVLPNGQTAELEQVRVKGGQEKADATETRVKGGQEKADATETRVKGGQEKADATETRVKGGQEKAEATETRVKGGQEKAEATETRVKGGQEKTDATETRVKGEPQQAEPERRFGGDAKAAEEERRRILAAAAQGKVISTKVEGVTEHIELEKVSVGKTDHLNDEKIVIKGSNAAAQELMDKAVVTFKADTPAEVKELKLKTVAASSDLMKAALAGTADSVATLLAAAANLGVELRKTDAEGRNALHYAAMGGSVPVIKLLLEKGSQLNSVDSKRRSPLFLAAFYRQPDAFQFLLDAGAKISQQAIGGMTIAMIGAFTHSMPILKAAIERGVRPDTKDHSGKTALDFAKQTKNEEAVIYLEGLEKAAKEAKTKKAA